MSEQWLPIVGYEGLYEVSDLGNVRVTSTGQVRKQRPNWGGYASVDLRKDGKYKKHSVHLLVIEAFKGPAPSPDLVCRHDDGDKANNSEGNLIWGTPAANQQDRIRHGTDLRGTKHPKGKLSNEDALIVKRRALAGESGVALAAEYGISPSLVSGLKTEKFRKFLGA